jgi:hypothetical protein
MYGRDTDRGEEKYLEINLTNCHVVATNPT